MERSAFDRDRAEPQPGSESRAGRKHDIPTRERCYRLSSPDLRTLKTVATFRTIDARDLPEGQATNLIKSGLVDRKTVYAGRQKVRMEVLTATRAGKDLLESGRALEDLQRFHSGLVKPNELAHDAAIYPAYLEEAAAIEKAGGVINRVVLDYEFKSIVNKEMNKKEGPPVEERRARLAKDLDLQLVDDKLPLPDLRIEYTDEHGQEQRRDVEITTRHYRGAHRAGKARSGFKMVNKDRPGKIRVKHDRPGGTPQDDHRLDFM
jgi:hypothetical protein